MFDIYPLDGVTTNPSILASCGCNPLTRLKEIRSLIGSDAYLHCQLLSSSSEAMIEEALALTDCLGDELYIKIPAVPEGFCAMRSLSAKGLNITATVVYTPMQALISAKSGAKYCAPYINRIDNIGGNGIETAKTIHDIYRTYGYETEVLAASFKNTKQLIELCAHGIPCATLAPDVLVNAVKNGTVDNAVDVFAADFTSLCGAGKTMLDLIRGEQ